MYKLSCLRVSFHDFSQECFDLPILNQPRTHLEIVAECVKNCKDMYYLQDRAQNFESCLLAELLFHPPGSE